MKTTGLFFIFFLISICHAGAQTDFNTLFDQYSEKRNFSVAIASGKFAKDLIKDRNLHQSIYLVELRRLKIISMDKHTTKDYETLKKDVELCLAQIDQKEAPAGKNLNWIIVSPDKDDDQAFGLLFGKQNKTVRGMIMYLFNEADHSATILEYDGIFDSKALNELLDDEVNDDGYYDYNDYQ